MNVMVRSLRFRRADSGDAVYKILLIVACVAMALAAFFPIYEWVTLYKAPETLPAAQKLSLDASAAGARETPREPPAAAPAPAPAPGGAEAVPSTTVPPKPGVKG